MKKMLLSLVALSIFWSIKTVSAQEILQGQVIDYEGYFMQGASVAIYEEGRLVRGVTTDEDGGFSVEMNSSEIMKITYLGYRELVYDMEEVKYDNLVVLEEETYNLSTVLVTVPGNYRIDSHTCCCVTVVRHEQAEKKGEETLPRAPDWTYFPNPTSGQVQVQSQANRVGQIEVLNANGALLSKFPVSNKTTSINLNNYPNGTYLFRYSDERGMEHIGRVVKVE